MGGRLHEASPIAISTRRSRLRNRIRPRPTPTTSALGGYIPSDAGQFHHLRASSVPMRRQSKHSWIMPSSMIRHSKWCTFRLKANRSSAICGCQKMRSGPVPLVIAVNGLDSRKEDLTESFGAILPFGIGLSSRRWPRHRAGSHQSQRDFRTHAVEGDRLCAIAAGDRQEPHRTARGELGRLLGYEDGHC